MTILHRLARLALAAMTGWLLAVAAMLPVDAQQATTCRVIGKITSGTTSLPGVSIVVQAAGTVKAVTSTEPDGTYRVTVLPGSYTLKAELTGFAPVERELSLGEPPCDATMDLSLGLLPRGARAAAARGTPTAPAAAGQGRGAAPNGPRFETLTAQTQSTAAAGLEVNPPDTGDAAARLLLPPGFSTDAPTQAVSVTGNMASIDRGMMAERMDAIGRGEFDPITGEFAQGFGPPGGPGGRGGPGGGPGGREGGPGGRGGPGGFMMGGRGRGQNSFNLQANYGYAGSALDSAPYELRPGANAQQRPYNRQNFGVTVGGPVRIPGLFNATRTTSFSANYAGSRGGDLFDQYATVPTAAMRDGNFSSARVQLYDPATGLPFAGNQIPASRVNAGASALLKYIPLPNLDSDSRNFHRVATNESASDSINVRVTHNFTPNARGGGPGGGRGGGRMGGAGGPGGRGGPLTQQGTSVMLTGQLQYRRNENTQNNVFPTLGGVSSGSSLAVPVSLNVQHKRQLHAINVNVSRTSSDALNHYAYVEDVAGAAGIAGVSTDPFDWGVPRLSFSSFTGMNDMAPSARTDTRWTFGYGWTRPFATHTVRIGGDFRLDRSDNRTNTNPRGAFVFTGLYASGGSTAAQSGGVAFADFLLGAPQQATVQYGPDTVSLSGKSFSAYIQDDWRKSSTLTFNLGVRYELMWPFVERTGQMVNLDVAPDFTDAVPVLPGATGPYSGAYSSALMDADTNNVAPRVGFAWRARPGTIVRGGYGISYNAGSYSTIARNMVGQPPFAVTEMSLGALGAPLLLQDPFANASPTAVTNNFGVHKTYALGVVQTWNADVSREVRQAWSVGAGYTHTRGSSLDTIRAPNRGPSGLLIPDVQAFLWQTSEGSSVLHAGSFRLQRRPIKGVGGGVTYTLARSRDNASSMGGGGATVAQNDKDLDAEWALSSFNRTHQLSANVSIELPFGPNRPWLSGGGTWAALLRDWRAGFTFIWQSGTPLTARVQAAATEVAQGTNGTLRADYLGGDIQLPNPSADRFFNTSAFAAPAPGLFGTSVRNMIIGPGSKMLNANFARDVRLGGTRAVTIQLTASNLLNLVNYGTVDTVVNSPTFGQVLSVRPMRSMQLNFRFRY